MPAFAILILSIFLLTETPFPEADSAPEAVQTLDPYGIYGADEDERAEVEAGIEALTSAGLPLPDLRIYVHDTEEGCGGNLGLFRQGGDLHRVDICLVEQALIRHELAHAWEHHSMDEATRQEFMERTGLETWNDHDEAHHSRAIEEAAYLVVFGLESAPIQRISASHYSEDLALYELLTGSPSPRVSHWDDEQVHARLDHMADATLVPEAVFS
jgi:hypothetical protein